jgi:hypothetical protein
MVLQLAVIGFIPVASRVATGIFSQLQVGLQPDFFSYK